MKKFNPIIFQGKLSPEHVCNTPKNTIKTRLERNFWPNFMYQNMKFPVDYRTNETEKHLFLAYSKQMQWLQRVRQSTHSYNNQHVYFSSFYLLKKIIIMKFINNDKLHVMIPTSVLCVLTLLSYISGVIIQNSVK